MVCPKCKKDYRDVPRGRPKGGYFRGDDHYYAEFRRFGMICTNCGFIAEMITRPTGNPYIPLSEKNNENDEYREKYRHFVSNGAKRTAPNVTSRNDNP